MLAGVSPDTPLVMRCNPEPQMTAEGLPRWPIGLAFIGYSLGWVLGLGDIIWIISSFTMVILLWPIRSDILVPKRFGLWLLFLGLIVASAITLDSPGRILGFGYRLGLYLAATVFFVYTYNLRRDGLPSYIGGVSAALWLQTTIGGWLGLLWPTFELTTPMARLLPAALLSNELVHEMVYRRFTSYNPDAWNPLYPRPSAPFLYTNGWGNVYSILTPVVVAWIITHRGSDRARALTVALPLSLVPAMLTLNRGMFIGLAVTTCYLGARYIRRLNVARVGTLVIVVAVTAVLAWALPVSERLTTRLVESSTTADRALLYWETFHKSLASPILGYGAPHPADEPWLPSLGTQGQFWQIMFSHGFVALALFLTWLFVTFASCHRRAGLLQVTMTAAVLVTLVESLYYGILGTGLICVLTMAAVVLNPNAQQGDPPPN